MGKLRLVVCKTRFYLFLLSMDLKHLMGLHTFQILIPVFLCSLHSLWNGMVIFDSSFGVLIATEKRFFAILNDNLDINQFDISIVWKIKKKFVLSNVFLNQHDKIILTVTDPYWQNIWVLGFSSLQPSLGFDRKPENIIKVLRYVN